MIAWATQSVTTSASVTLRLAFFCPLGQEIVGGAEHRSEQQVEVGEHRGPLGSTALLDTADFDLLPSLLAQATLPRPAAWNQSSRPRHRPTQSRFSCRFLDGRPGFKREYCKRLPTDQDPDLTGL